MSTIEQFEAVAAEQYRTIIDRVVATGDFSHASELSAVSFVLDVTWQQAKADIARRRRMLEMFAEGDSLEEPAEVMQPEVEAAVKLANTAIRARDAEQRKHDAAPDCMYSRNERGNIRRNPLLDRLRKQASEAESKAEAVKYKQDKLWELADRQRAQANLLQPGFAAKVFEPLAPKTGAAHAAELARKRTTHAAAIQAVQQRIIRAETAKKSQVDEETDRQEHNDTVRRYCGTSTGQPLDGMIFNGKPAHG